jgi:hypothetical protein
VFSRRGVTMLAWATLAFGCERHPDRIARWDHELVQVAGVIGQAAGDIDPHEGALLLLLGTSIAAPVPSRGDEHAPMPDVVEPVIVGQLLVDVPEVGAKAGDRVVFRPDNPDWSRRCVVMHTADAEQFLHALDSGALEIIANPNPSVDDPRAMLQDRIRHPQGPRLRVL